MVFTIIMKLVLDLLIAIFGILPTLPAMPSVIVTAGNWVLTQVGNFTSVINMVFGSTLATAIFVIIIGLFTFEWIYHSTMWLLTKIGVLGIKR